MYRSGQKPCAQSTRSLSVLVDKMKNIFSLEKNCEFSYAYIFVIKF